MMMIDVVLNCDHAPNPSRLYWSLFYCSIQAFFTVVLRFGGYL